MFWAENFRREEKDQPNHQMDERDASRQSGQAGANIVENSQQSQMVVVLTDGGWFRHCQLLAVSIRDLVDAFPHRREFPSTE